MKSQKAGIDYSIDAKLRYTSKLVSNPLVSGNNRLFNRQSLQPTTSQPYTMRPHLILQHYPDAPTSVFFLFVCCISTVNASDSDKEERWLIHNNILSSRTTVEDEFVQFQYFTTQQGMWSWNSRRFKLEYTATREWMYVHWYSCFMCGFEMGMWQTVSCLERSLLTNVTRVKGVMWCAVVVVRWVLE